MKTKGIPKHLLLQIQDEKRGLSYRGAIKFAADDFSHYIQLEHKIVCHIIKKMGFRQSRFVEQTIVITKKNQVFDLLDVEVNRDGVLRFHFDITQTFGRWSENAKKSDYEDC
jgi:hypothetical protein